MQLRIWPFQRRTDDKPEISEQSRLNDLYTQLQLTQDELNREQWAIRFRQSIIQHQLKNPSISEEEHQALLLDRMVQAERLQSQRLAQDQVNQDYQRLDRSQENLAIFQKRQLLREEQSLSQNILGSIEPFLTGLWFPLLLLIVGLVANYQAEIRDTRIARVSNHRQILESYINSFQEVQLNEDYATTSARAKYDFLRGITLSSLREMTLDIDRKAQLVLFLYQTCAETCQIRVVKSDNSPSFDNSPPSPFLNTADLKFANFRGYALESINLQGADLRGADFTLADLRQSNLSHTQFTCEIQTDQIQKFVIIPNESVPVRGFFKVFGDLANFTQKIQPEILYYEDIEKCSSLTQANLTGANLTGATIDDAVLAKAKLCEVQLPARSTLDPDRDCPPESE